MIKIENIDTYGWEAAIRGMRNPMNSWDKSDTEFIYEDCELCLHCSEPCSDYSTLNNGTCFKIGQKDLELMHKLVAAGSDHRKFLRMINVTCDITAPFYWWKEFDTYKIGTVANSCSTMHKLTEKEFTLDDFSHDKLYDRVTVSLKRTIEDLNFWRTRYLESNDKCDWWQMIQLLPTSYNQKRTVQMNYEVLANMYLSRKNHKLDEWRIDFCNWVEKLPFFTDIIGGDL